jgi:hypothetical protein
MDTGRQHHTLFMIKGGWKRKRKKGLAGRLNKYIIQQQSIYKRIYIWKGYRLPWTRHITVFGCRLYTHITHISWLDKSSGESFPPIPSRLFLLLLLIRKKTQIKLCLIWPIAAWIIVFDFERDTDFNRKKKNQRMLPGIGQKTIKVKKIKSNLFIYINKSRQL